MFFDSTGARALAGACAISASFITLAQIVRHLRHYTEPVHQRYIVRILFMVPVYAATALPSLLSEHNAPYFTTVRECYEAWVIYNFMSLCLAYVGGPGAVEVKMAGVVLPPSWAAGTCCLPPLAVDGAFVRACKRGALQFVFVKPVLAVATAAMYATGGYEEGDWSPGGGYLWVALVYNVTYSVALYALLLFYLGTHELLAPFRPLLKFALIKAVVFLTFWQGFAIAFLVGAGVLPTPADGTNAQNFLICVEMLPAAVGLLFAFPPAEYAGDAGAGGAGAGGGAAGLAGLAPAAVLHALSIRDLAADTVHQFAPAYGEYVLYSDGTRRRAGGKPGGGGAARAPAGAADDADLLANVEMGSAAAWRAKQDARGAAGGGAAGGGGAGAGGGGGDDDESPGGSPAPRRPSAYLSGDDDEEEAAAAAAQQRQQWGTIEL